MNTMIAGVLLFYLVARFGTNSVNAECDNCSVCGKGPPRLPIRELPKCGIPIPNTKTFPWLVSLGQHQTDKHCAGTILDEYFILTAASCLIDEPDKPDKWNKGTKVFFQTKCKTRFSKAAAIENVVVHPRYKLVASNTTGNLFEMYDIALIKLKEKIKCNKYKRSICLPKADYRVSTDKMFHYAGWGHGKQDIQDVPTESQILRYGFLDTVPFKTCITCAPETRAVKDHMLCLSDSVQRDCLGQSGAPLISEINNKYTVFGVASFEPVSKCQTEAPLLYTNVAVFVNWIEEQKRKILKQSSHSKRLKYGRNVP